MQKLNFSHVLAWSLMLTIPFWFGSCKKEETTPTPSSTSIDGTYKISTLKVDPKVLGIYDDLIAASKLLFNNTTCLNDLTITFKTNGDAAADNPTSCQSIGVPVSMFTGISTSSKWTSSNNKLTITQADGTKTEYTILSNAGGILKLQWQGLLNYPTPSTTMYTYTMELKKS
ncbi:hypothetical protein GCM10028807_20340 [Spirosoma daeguense]